MLTEIIDHKLIKFPFNFLQNFSHSRKILIGLMPKLNEDFKPIVQKEIENGIVIDTQLIATLKNNQSALFEKMTSQDRLLGLILPVSKNNFIMSSLNNEFAIFKQKECYPLASHREY